MMKRGMFHQNKCIPCTCRARIRINLVGNEPVSISTYKPCTRPGQSLRHISVGITGFAVDSELKTVHAPWSSLFGWVGGWVVGWLGGWVGEWVVEWVGGWVREWVRE